MPTTMLAKIGRITALWAHIEQDLTLHASAMAAQHTDGHPTEYLRMDFKRLREKWYDLCRASFDDATQNKIVNPLNSELARISIARGNVVHGLWTANPDGQFSLHFWEQKHTLEKFETPYSEEQLQALTDAIFNAAKRLKRFSYGNHSGKDGLGALAEVGRTLTPSDQR